jgi:hypothetical protein
LVLQKSSSLDLQFQFLQRELVQIQSHYNQKQAVLRPSPVVLSMWSCTVKFDERNATNAGLIDSGKWVWLRIIAQVAVAGKRRSSSVHL